LKLYTIPLKFIDIDVIDSNILEQSIEYNDQNLEYIREFLDKNSNKLSPERTLMLETLIATNILVKPATSRFV
jgi:hypothetical protein